MRGEIQLTWCQIGMRKDLMSHQIDFTFDWFYFYVDSSSSEMLPDSISLYLK